jgi:hypothetical protein
VVVGGAVGVIVDRGGGRWSSGEEGGVVKWCVVEVHQLKGMDQDIQ